jgi:hypothetical protein
LQEARTFSTAAIETIIELLVLSLNDTIKFVSVFHGKNQPEVAHDETKPLIFRGRHDGLKVDGHVGQFLDKGS